ncbi:protein-glutamate methylesterase/protein-glutamine glutaminase [Alteromonas lipolytica]|uniref:Protein-glutamate methylesterase/protein-glutamine glutaminase n=1 Tax=Alteromonas lipolytica TaxID=1856405 RepID=A0A1E8FHX9_9ALTE|nr:chemotaxis response regulator protein-glutamate methylesterase [Alteromonas lipolytica]OFI35542.1 chemotaxis response regulator protein-glutamate methylesterase [Alteromonas lipolytica]GGF77058.1 chemotaxis response regulator protein-glutamate methylesterase of group 2 operon [Alteromonas lipolytica]
MTISVLVVDDSALIRSLMTQIISAHPELTLVGTAPDAFVAKDMVKRFNPDVITLDIEMPRVDGLTFLDRLMKAKPTPVVMISTLTEKGADATMLALELGAIDFIPKPKIDVQAKFMAFQQLVTTKILEAARAKVKKRVADAEVTKTQLSYSGTELIVGIGASTGGTEAIKELLVRLPASFPAVVMTQHMPPGFTTSFAKRLNGLCALTVKEAKHNERLLPGHAYLAPGDQHLSVIKYGADYRLQLSDHGRVSGHKPSVDVLFNSLAEQVGHNAFGVILTGMGKDGADGMRAMHDKGAVTFAQDEASCVVYGMPKEAVRRGGVDKSLPIPDIATQLTDAIRQKAKGNRL